MKIKRQHKRAKREMKKHHEEISKVAINELKA